MCIFYKYIYTFCLALNKLLLRSQTLEENRTRPQIDRTSKGCNTGGVLRKHNIRTNVRPTTGQKISTLCSKIQKTTCRNHTIYHLHFLYIDVQNVLHEILSYVRVRVVENRKRDRNPFQKYTNKMCFFYFFSFSCAYKLKLFFRRIYLL